MSAREGGHRTFALAAALTGWAAVALQMGLTLRNSLAAGHGIGHGLVIFFGFFTITTNIFAALVLTAHAGRFQSSFWQFFRRPVVITSATLSMVIVGAIYFFVLRRLWQPQGLQYVVDVLLHYVMPPVTLAFWWRVVPRGAVRWNGLGAMLVYPLAYLVYVFARGPLVGSYPYFFIDVTTLGLSRALLNAAGVALLFLVVLSLMLLANHHRAPHPTSD